jgi:hypothetical protein
MAEHNNVNRASANVREYADESAHVPEQIAAAERRREALLKEYSEVASNFRMLTDIRFKLLALLPIAAAAATAVAQESPGAIRLGLSLFGLVVTIGLLTYNTRNDQLYDELVRRAGAIERSLGNPDGAFANRPMTWLRIEGLFGRKWSVDHRVAISTIYSASIALWLFGIMAYALDSTVKSLSVMSADLIAIAVAIIVTALGRGLIKRQRKAREENMQRRAAEAVAIAVGRTISETVSDPKFIETCAKLSDIEEGKIRARAKFYAAADTEQIRNYIPQHSRELSACQLIALLTDLPPLWIFDCYTNRMGNIQNG